MQIIFVANAALWRTKILGIVIENLPSTSITYQTGLEIISWLAPVKLSGQTYFCLDTTCFWPHKNLSFIWNYLMALYSKIHADYYKNTLQYYTHYSRICGDNFIEDKAISF